MLTVIFARIVFGRHHNSFQSTVPVFSQRPHTIAVAVITLIIKNIMFHYYRFCALLLFTVSLTFLSGCGSKGPKVYYVEGIVTLDGIPVGGCSVNFVPKQESQDSNDLSAPLYASGDTDPHGKYKLSATRGAAVGAGTTAGEYKVSLSKRKYDVPVGPDGRPTGPPKITHIIPQVFEDDNNSRVSVEVIKGKNVFNFALKSDGTFEVTK